MKHELGWLISVDDHVLEPGDLWLSRVPTKYHDRAPRLIDVDGGAGQMWAYEDLREPVTGLSATAGTDKDEWSMGITRYDLMRPGFYDPVARIADLDAAGILASMCFPSFARFCGQPFWEAKDKELALLCVKAYNDWMIEEWCAAAPGRYIPLTVIPLWDPQKAAAEVRRSAARGARAICFSENPEPLGLPTIWDPDRYWNPVWDACQETETVVCMHIGSSSTSPKISKDIPWGFNQAWAAGTLTSATLLTWLIGPVFREFPGVKIALSEGGIGWIPYFLERADFVNKHHKAWTHSGFKDAKPSEVFKRHFLTCFIDDAFGLENIERIGEDMVAYECDYPHSDSVWPDAPEVLWKSIKSLTAAQIDKVTHQNAMRFFNFDPFQHHSREDLTVGALRAQAAADKIDTTLLSSGGGVATPLAPGEQPRRVTTGDMARMLAGMELD